MSKHRSKSQHSNLKICTCLILFGGARYCGFGGVNWSWVIVRVPVHSGWQLTTAHILAAASTWCPTPRCTHTWRTASFAKLWNHVNRTCVNRKWILTIDYSLRSSLTVLYALADKGHSTKKRYTVRDWWTLGIRPWVRCWNAVSRLCLKKKKKEKGKIVLCKKDMDVK